MASTLCSYLLLFCGGWPHLLFLGRDYQAILYMTSWNLVGLGFLNDLIRIPSYVSQSDLRNNILREPNNDTWKLMLRGVVAHVGIGKPGWSFKSTIAQLGYGPLLGWVLSAQLLWIYTDDTIPMTVLRQVLTAVAYGVGMGAGVWLAGSTCPWRRSSVKHVVAAAVVTTTLTDLLIVDSNRLWAVGLTIVAFNWYSFWNEECEAQQPQNIFKRGFKVGTAVLLFWLLFGGASLNTMTVHSSAEDRPVRLSELLVKAYRSPEFAEAWKAFKTFYNNGFNENTIRNYFSESGAMDEHWRVLELDPALAEEITDAQIKQARRKLVLKYHPDKLPPGVSDEEREAANHKFRKIQESYEALLNRRDIHRNFDTMGQTYRSWFTQSNQAEAEATGTNAKTEPRHRRQGTKKSKARTDL